MNVAQSLWPQRLPPTVYDFPKPTMAGIAAGVAAKYDMTVDDLKCLSRCREVVWPRQEAMAAMRATGLWSFPRIGMFFGGRDHATVIHGVRAYNKRLVQAA